MLAGYLLVQFFQELCYNSLLENIFAKGENAEKMLVTIFSFSFHVFHPICETTIEANI